MHYKLLHHICKSLFFYKITFILILVLEHIMKVGDFNHREHSLYEEKIRASGEIYYYFPFIHDNYDSNQRGSYLHDPGRQLHIATGEANQGSY